MLPALLIRFLPVRLVLPGRVQTWAKVIRPSLVRHHRDRFLLPLARLLKVASFRVGGGKDIDNAPILPSVRS